MAKYQVNWDNGNHACGTFPEVFDTEEAAEAFGANWRREMCLIDGIDPDDEDDESYSYEVIEIEEDDEDPDQEAQFYAELRRGYDMDRI